MPYHSDHKKSAKKDMQDKDMMPASHAHMTPAEHKKAMKDMPMKKDMPLRKGK